jgi:DNA-binding protein H-NS
MPPMTELKSYPLPELEALAERIKAEILKREQEEQDCVRQAAEDLARKTAEAERLARAQAEAAAQAVAEAAAAAERAAQEAAPVRYMHPSNRALTWNGIPPRPEWIGAWLTTGGTLYALEVAAEKLAPKPIPGSFRPK